MHFDSIVSLEASNRLRPENRGNSITDNGPPTKSDVFRRFIMSRPELTHARTRHYAPQTNGVVERFNQSLKIERLYREDIAAKTSIDARRGRLESRRLLEGSRHDPTRRR